MLGIFAGACEMPAYQKFSDTLRNDFGAKTPAKSPMASKIALGESDALGEVRSKIRPGGAFAYEKFSEMLRDEISAGTPPKPSKAPKIRERTKENNRHLGAIDALVEQSIEGGPTRTNVSASEKFELEGFWSDVEEERAALVEFDAGVPRALAEALARMRPAEPPPGISPSRWLRFIDDCGEFLDAGWGAKALVLGWHPLNLFGCDRERPFARIDRSGLLWLLNGGKLVALSRDTATIETSTGARQTYHRRPIDADHIVLAWELSRVI
jgi:hypothetical protein